MSIIKSFWRKFAAHILFGYNNKNKWCLTMLQSLSDKAQQFLAEGESHAFEVSDDDDAGPSPDWAHRAARGIFYEMIHRAGISVELDEMTGTERKELVHITAEIIRQAHSSQTN
jgi:hypothetical protein